MSPVLIRAKSIFAASPEGGSWQRKAMFCYCELLNPGELPFFAKRDNIVGAFAGCVQQELPGVCRPLWGRNAGVQRASSNMRPDAASPAGQWLAACNVRVRVAPIAALPLRVPALPSTIGFA
jgi:hypothetical protein